MPATNISLQPEKWVSNYADQMYKYLLMRVKYAEVAEDLVQETFMAGLGSMEKFSGNSSEKTWLYSIMKFKLMDYYRKHYKYSPAEDIPDEQFADIFFDEKDEFHFRKEHKPMPWHSDVEQAMEQKEFNGVLEKCLEKVPSKTASVFTLKYLEEQESKEICTLLNISEANLWTLMHRAKLILRECFEKNWLITA